jgi:dihydrofolate reductase/catechol 2,3-dioxygenase-like lactoylglutathione lyase family enzyme
MGRTIMGAVVSLDGFMAYDDDTVGPLFDWLGNGDAEWKWSERQEEPLHTTQASKDFVKAVYPRIGAVVIGRRVFDLTDGWDGVPAAGDHVFVVTHAAPTDWKYAETAPFTFVTEGVEAAIAQAREFAGPDREVDVAAGQIGGQALRLGLIDQVVLNVVPVVFGSGRPFFGAMGPGDTIDLANPTRVAQGDRVLHLLYDVRGTIPRETTPRRNVDLFAGVPVRDYQAALAWYERLFGKEPAFFPNDIEAVWDLGENRWLYIKKLPERAGHALQHLFVDNLDTFVAEIAERGIEPVDQETYPGARKVIYRDPEGNQIEFGGATGS